MIAIYYYEHSGPYGMYALDVDGSDEKDFYRALLAQKDYPYPTSDVIIIDGTRVVNQFHSKYQSK